MKLVDRYRSTGIIYVAVVGLCYDCQNISSIIEVILRHINDIDMSEVMVT